MYKIFGFKPDERFGRVAEVEFSVPVRGRYAYLLGSFNAFNEGSFRMRKEGDRWVTRLELPEGVWHYAFSIDGKFFPDPENPKTENYRKLSYRFERRVSVATVKGHGPFFHRPSATYLYAIGGRTHVLLRTDAGRAENALLLVGEEEIPMVRKAGDVLFEYFEAVVPGRGEIEYSFEVRTGEGRTVTLGPFRAGPYEIRTPSWLFTRVFYQVMPDRFERGLSRTQGGRAFAGERFHGGDLAGVVKRLGYLEELGVNALYLTPIFESMTYHRYDVVDYFSIDGKLGGNGAFTELVGRLKERDMKLILDGVFHHTSFFHPWFQDVLLNGEKSEYRDFYRITGFPVVGEEFKRLLHSNLPWTEKYGRLRELERNYESFYSVWLMPRLNHDNPDVVRFIVRVMRYWIERGADGWRLDVAHGVPPEVWAEVRKRVPEGVYLVGEVMDDPRLWLFDKFHGTMNYPLYEAILRFFVRREIGAEEFLAHLELLSVYLGPAEYSMYNFLDNHDTERFIDLVEDEGKYLCALAFLMTYKGIPAIFYGDEIGLRGGGEGMSAGRRPMVWDPNKWAGDILGVTKALIGLRKSSRALQLGEFVPVQFQGGTLAYERVLGGERVFVAINYSGNTTEVRTPEVYREAAGGKVLVLPPCSFVVLLQER